MKSIFCNRNWARIGTVSALPLAVALAGCGPTAAPNTNVRESLVFPQTALPITVDGVATDAAWSSAFDYRLEDGAMLAAATMRGVTDANNIYLHFEVEDGQDEFDAVLLEFNQDGDPNNYRRMLIYPCFLATLGACTGTSAGHVPTVEYYSGALSGTDVNWTSDTAPAGVDVKSNYVPGAGGISSRWSVEMKLPKSLYSGFPATDAFAMFATTIATDQGMINTAREYSWPAGTLLNAADLSSAPSNTQRWGNVSLDPSTASAGLRLTGFSSNQSNPSLIALNQTNAFYATVANLSAGGPPPTAVNGVQATFKIANFGLPAGSTWANIPSASNPTIQVPVDGDEYRTLSSGDWNLATTGNWANSGQTEFDFFTDHPHQCVRVEITNTSGIASFSQQFNMDFVTINSPFESTATIAVADWQEQVPAADTIVLREGFANLGRMPWTSKFGGVEQVGKTVWSLPFEKVRGAEQRLDLTVDPGALRIPSKVFELAADPVSLDAKPGSIVTILVDEHQKVRNQNNAERRKGVVITPQTVIGSFDGFQTSFAVGSGQTFLVPAGAQRLDLRYRGEQKLEAPLVAQAIVTGITPAVRQAMPFIDHLRKSKAPTLLPLAINLPFHFVRGEVVTNRKIVIRGRPFFVAMPMGSFTHAVRSVGPVRVN